MAHPKAVYCLDCRPYHRRPPPPCRRCGSLDYYTSGLCVRCHKYAPALPSSCPHCLSWGLFKNGGGICPACRDWRARNPRLGRCGSCGHDSTLNLDGWCRLCYRRARALARADGGDEQDTRRAEAVAGGHQLFLANLEHALALKVPGRRRQIQRSLEPVLVAAPIRPNPHRQGLLFEAPRDLSRIARTDIGPPPVPLLAEALEAAAVERGHAYGWPNDVTSAVRRALRLLLAIQDTPGAAIKASDAARLRPFNLQATPVLEVLSSVGMLDDDRPPAIITWFAQQIRELPDQMAAELRAWFTVMREGSTTPPRMRARTDRTTRNHLTSALPALRTFAERYDSLREVTRDDVLGVLPCGAIHRKDVLFGLRSIFRVLKGRKLTFINPTAGIRSSRLSGRTPLPVQVNELRDALDPANPVRAALAALLIFHGVRPRDLRNMHLLDVRDGRLHIGGRIIPLALAAAERLTAYLNYRVDRWPRTANPHLFINALTATRTTEVTYVWVNDTLGTPAHRFREDRILDEIHATDGDIRRASDMFGLTIPPLLRYLATLNHPDLDTA